MLEMRHKNATAEERKRDKQSALRQSAFDVLFPASAFSWNGLDNGHEKVQGLTYVHFCTLLRHVLYKIKGECYGNKIDNILPI